MACMTCHEETIVATVVNGQEAIKVARDKIDTSPREWDNLGVISMCADKSRGGHPWLGEETYHVYGCEDHSDRPGKCGEELFAGTLAYLPLFVDDWKWKTVIRTAPNSDDEVPDGYIYATVERAAAMGCVSARTGRMPAAKALGMLRDEIAAYNQYLAGEVYEARLVRTGMCDKGVAHEEVLDDLHGLYPPYDGNIDVDGRCMYKAWASLGTPNPADHAVRVAIEECVGTVNGGERASLGWYNAAAECLDLSDEAREYWAGKARALEAATTAASGGRKGRRQKGGMS